MAKQSTCRRAPSRVDILMTGSETSSSSLAGSQSPVRVVVHVRLGSIWLQWKGYDGPLAGEILGYSAMGLK